MKMEMFIRAGLLCLCLGWSLPSYAAKEAPPIYPSVPGQLVVKLAAEPDLKAGITFERVARDLQTSLGIKSLIKVRHFLTSDRFAVLKLDDSELKSARAALARDSRVAYAEPNYLYHIVGSPNDDQFSSLWGMRNVGQNDAAGQSGFKGSDIDVSPLWNEGVTGSKSVKVAIIDTGIDDTHPDLAANVDASLGYNFVSNTPEAKDDHGHGTHCAGTIGAIGNNGLGVAGVNWSVTLIPVKFLNAQGGGTLDAAVQAIQWATKQGVNIMSNSWGGGPYTQALYDAIAEARDHGITFIAAAGNDSSDNDATPSYPASYDLPNVISVAATDNRDELAYFSNYGSTSVDVAAPGVQILSTAPGGKYAVMSGTSMATPHVSGIAALMLSANPSLTYEQIKDVLIRSSDPVESLSKMVVSKGRVNAYNAIHGIFPPNPAPDESLWKDYDYTLESPHPYEGSKTYNYSVNVSKAKYVRIVFDSIDTEKGYDVMTIRDGKGRLVERLSGALSNYVSGYIAGGKASILFTTDDSVNKTGFKVAKLQVIR